MTIKQKAIAYDKAIEKFKSIYDLAKEQGRDIDVEEFERIFPELKESEDELTWLTKYIKEQRDLLFAKMKEAGYVWDTEKKELRKISQEYPLTPDECIKPTWSEKDEETLDSILNDLRQNVIPDEEDISWLKSLKIRVQPKQKWGEDDKENISMLIDLVESKEESIEVKIGLSTWLKSLKDRITWKPSEEQMKWFKDILDYHQFSSEGQEIMQSLYEKLKKL